MIYGIEEKIKKMKYKNYISILFITLLLPILGISQEVGKEVQWFEAQNLNGTNFKLSQLKGKVIILDFWASWCSPCKKEMPYLVDLYKSNDKANFEIVAVNLDKKQDKISLFINSLAVKPNFTIVWDQLQKLPNDFKVEAMPTTLFIDKKGKIRYRKMKIRNYIKKNYWSY